MALVSALPCPVCGGTEVRAAYPLLDLVYEKPGTWTFVRCSGCGHGMIDPRPDESDLAALYAEYYDETVTGFMSGFNESGLVRRFHRARIRAIVEALADRPVRRVVDVGCGLGHFLTDLRQVLRVRGGDPPEAIGVEPGAGAALEARQRLGETDLDGPASRVLEATIDEVDLEDGSVDLLTMNHVLEHHPRPERALARAARLLAPGGVMEVEVPRIDGLPRRLLGRWWWLHIPPQHLHLFTREGLPRLMKQVGFAEVVSVRCGGLPLHLTLAWRSWLRHTFGSKSRFARNPLIQIPVWTVGLAMLVVTLLGDLVFGPLHSLLGGGDVLTVVARKGE